MNYSKL
ncbi:uncharacterized protein ARMOST_20656 [Armillaria ostoyae]|nr:uncharacterized protein ARMOST_20656 [Armillaria ostoyae]